MLEIVTSLSHLLIAFAFSLKHFDTSLIAGSEETSAGFLLRHALKVGLPKPFLWQEKACGCNREGLTSQVSTRPFLGHLFGGGQPLGHGLPIWHKFTLHFHKIPSFMGNHVGKETQCCGMCWSWLISEESISHVFLVSSLPLCVRNASYAQNCLTEVKLSHPDPADVIRGTKGSSRTSGPPWAWTVAPSSTQCLLSEWMLLNQRVDESVKMRFSWKKALKCLDLKHFDQKKVCFLSRTSLHWKHAQCVTVWWSLTSIETSI